MPVHPLSKLTPEVHARIVNFVRSGAYIETAALACNVTKRTLYDWIHRGRDPNAPEEYRSFVADLEKAQADDELRSVLQVEQLAASASAVRTAPCPRCRTLVKVAVPSAVQLQAVTWKLERKYPERYGSTLKIEHRTRGRMQELLEAVRPRMSEGAYREFLAALEAELGGSVVDSPTALAANYGDDATH